MKQRKSFTWLIWLQVIVLLCLQCGFSRAETKEEWDYVYDI